MKSTYLLISCAGLLALVTGARGDQPVETGGPPTIIVHRTNPHVDTDSPTAGGTSSLSPIIDHHGPVLGNTVNAYVIWYGNWSQLNGSDDPGGQRIIRDFLSNVGNSPYFQINTTYGPITGNVNFAGETTDTGSQGTRLSDSKVQAIVSSAISSGRLGSPDTNGVYFVLTSSNVSENSGFCVRYCGWHTYGSINGSNIKYSFVGNANRCLSGCAAQTISPNANAGVDGMISVIAHELEEAVTDPNLNAWYDSKGAENADKCAWTFGSDQTRLTSGAYYNMKLGTRYFLIQRNLDATDNKCYVSYKGQQ